MIKHYENKQLEVAVFQEAKSGKRICGDAHIVIERKGYNVCAVIDGLGSGEWASHSAEVATAVIMEEHDKPVCQIVDACNRALLNKRGVVLTIVKVEFDKNELSYCNVGNVGFILYQPDGTIIKPLPARGYLSGRTQKLSSLRYQFQRGSVFAMYSDGVSAPLTNKLLIETASPKTQIHEFISKKKAVAQDDTTLLIGKFK